MLLEHLWNVMQPWSRRGNYRCNPWALPLTLFRFLGLCAFCIFYLLSLTLLYLHFFLRQQPLHNYDFPLHWSISVQADLICLVFLIKPSQCPQCPALRFGKQSRSAAGISHRGWGWGRRPAGETNPRARPSAGSPRSRCWPGRTRWGSRCGVEAHRFFLVNGR